MKKHPIILLSILLASCTAPGSNTGMNHGGMNHGPGMMNGGGGGFLPAQEKDVSELPEAKPSEILEIQDGGTITLNPTLVQKSINGEPFAMYAYNGQFPGPTLKVAQGSTFTVKVTNNIDLPTTVHWHGIRLDNKFDGAAGVTQEAIEPGDSFTYTVRVPDEGVFWYHPHVREDLQQDMGLYGLLHVTPKDANAYPPVDQEEYIVLDDMLLDDNGAPVAYGEREADHALMGRFGNVMLTNGRFVDAGASLDPPGTEMETGITRFFFLNAANTRTFNIQIVPVGAEDNPVPMTLIGGDAGRYAREITVESLILSPSERAIVEMRFPEPGKRYQIVNATPKGMDLLGLLWITGDPTRLPPMTLRTNDDAARDIDAFRAYFDKPVDKTLHLSVEAMMGGGMMMGHGSEETIEWEDPMPHMNAMATKGNTQWKLIDGATEAENMDIHYRFNIGDKVKIRIVNDTEEDGSDHPMQHPIHFHGQRFLVLSVDGKPNANLVWKDTVLVEKGKTVDILLDVTNPGDWMIHCHIAEHLSNGMMGMFTVE